VVFLEKRFESLEVAIPCGVWVDCSSFLGFQVSENGGLLEREFELVSIKYLKHEALMAKKP
jgi:hypothetical protein